MSSISLASCTGSVGAWSSRSRLRIHACPAPCSTWSTRPLFAAVLWYFRFSTACTRFAASVGRVSATPGVRSENCVALNILLSFLKTASIMTPSASFTNASVKAIGLIFPPSLHSGTSNPRSHKPATLVVMSLWTHSFHSRATKTRSNTSKNGRN